MNAVIKPQACPCCAIKDKNIEQYEGAIQVRQEVVAMQAAKIEELQMAFTREVAKLTDVINQQKATIRTQEAMLRFADARHNRSLERAQSFSANQEAWNGRERRQFRGAWAREKLAAIINGAPK